ncbi:hypothetical protein [Herbiconiux daphne]|uniref:CoF synthetase n=1 Tax=Herbiconiux daphne TaxID=2970914 RepID=A0ABT2H2L0_9MICO|nr:hypothetical protein [Herbiconiux daphne]MCS5734150.1 hypothetical protein [Herbiconiux daphne]
MTDRALVAVLAARFVRARWGMRFRSRARFDAWQRRRIRSFLRRLPEAPFYRDIAAAADRPGRLRLLDQLPIVDKSTLLARFDELNTHGVRLADAMSVALEGERTRDFSGVVDGDLSVGLSSGTSGRRGVFLVSPRERMLWAGTILARVLDRQTVAQVLRPWRPPVRIAFFLRAGGSLYESVASSRIRFAFFDLTRPIEAHAAVLDAAASRGQAADVVVAPASVLAALARRSLDGGSLEGGSLDGGQLAGGSLAGGSRMSPRLVISVAEVLDPDVADLVERAWGAAPRQVYQATEGLLAITCEHGALHLNEESVHIEREWLDAERTRFIPVVTDFDRRTQIIARYRLDDVIRVGSAARSFSSPSSSSASVGADAAAGSASMGAGAAPGSADPAAGSRCERCACGRVTEVVAGVDGRADAVLRLPSLDGRSTVEVFPDVVRRAMTVASRGYSDWRIRQTGLDLHVSLDEVDTEHETEAEAAAQRETRVAAVSGAVAAEAALTELFDAYGCHATIVFDPWTPPEPGMKVRRIVRESTS